MKKNIIIGVFFLFCVLKAYPQCITYSVEVCVDGEDKLHIKGTQMWWEHILYWDPGTHPSCTTSILVNGNTWTPWNVPYTIPSTTGYSLTINVIQCSNICNLIQSPNASNGWETIYDFDDIAPGSAHIFEISFTYCPFLNVTATPDQYICLGQSATISASGASSYLWSTGDTTSSITVFPNITTTYAVTGSLNGNTGQDSVTIYVSSITADSIATNDILCNGLCNGTGSISVSGGFAPYTYNWNTTPPQTTYNASGLCAGNYIVSVTDSIGCTFQQSLNITEPSSVTASVSHNNINCHGDCNGTAAVSPSGGSPPYSYNWNTTPIQTTPNITGLCSGNYSVTITDSAGCLNQQSITISEPTEISTGVNHTDILCNGVCNGAAVVATAGGSPPYSYIWNTTPVQTTSNIAGLCAGNYSVIITDSLGCINQQAITIAEPPKILSGLILNNISCNGLCNGEATLATSGGFPPYSYIWNTSPVQTSANITGLCAGNYTVFITDSAGCTLLQTAMITEPPILLSSITSTNILCNDACDGTAAAITSGGTPPYTYNWNTTPPQTTNIATGLCAGNYIVSITDSAGCTFQQSVNITEPPILLSSIISNNILCNGACNGTAAALTSGGSPPYIYIWNTTPIQTTSNITGLCAGNYSVSITDSAGCTIQQSITITEPPEIALGISHTNVLCNGICNGAASVAAAGGSPPYTYNWNTLPNQTTSNITGLCAGFYTVTVTDSAGCMSQQTATIAEPTAMISSINSTDILCNGPCEGTANVIVTGGSPPYSYNWNTTPVQTTESATGLCEGDYFVTIMDSNNCIQTQTTTINSTSGINIIVGATNYNIYSGESTQLSASGGSTYHWNPAAGLSCTDCFNPIASPLTTTTYCVVVSDTNDCKDSACVTINVDIQCGEIFVPTAFSPNNDGQNELECVFGNCIQSLYFAIYDRWGEMVFETTDQKICWDGNYRGKPMNTAVFVYYLKATLNDGNEKVMKGNISLVR